jgi:Terminase RNaseH-like domain
VLTGASLSKGVVTCTWDDVPHLSEDAKARMLGSYPPFQRDARSKGIPQLGAGAIYPVPESEITVEDFAIPAHYPRAYALDVGWNFTAAPWGARDPESGTVYIYSVYKRGQAEPAIHAQAVKSRGGWIPGTVDPAARGRSQVDGEQLIQTYADLGLNLTPADNAVEAGIYMVWEMLSTGKLKVFKSCRPWFEEYRLYRRDEKGKIVKVADHLMDGTRYLVRTGMSLAVVKPIDAGESPTRIAGAWF